MDDRKAKGRDPGRNKLPRDEEMRLPIVSAVPQHIVPGLRSSLHFQSERHMPGLEDPEGHSEPATSSQPSPVHSQHGLSTPERPIDEQMAATDAVIYASSINEREDPGPAKGMSVRPPQSYGRGAENLHLSEADENLEYEREDAPYSCNKHQTKEIHENNTGELYLTPKI
jgi:hypothetical protein